VKGKTIEVKEKEVTAALWEISKVKAYNGSKWRFAFLRVLYQVVCGEGVLLPISGGRGVNHWHQACAKPSIPLAFRHCSAYNIVCSWETGLPGLSLFSSAKEIGLSNLTTFAETTFRLRYAQHENETWTQAAERVAKHLSQAEPVEKRASFQKEVTGAMSAMDLIPGGRVIYGSGRNKGQLGNCFALDVEDSRESLGKLFQDIMIISSTGGGVGINFSKLRPLGDPIRSIGGEASGPISFARIVDTIGDVIKAGGSRRAAFIGVLSVSHPDIFRFIDAKLSQKLLSNMNISILVNNSFLECLREKRPFPLQFRGKTYGEADPTELWDKIISNGLACGDPGLLNEDMIRRGNNSEYYAPFVSTNPCSEILLENKGCCMLASVNLGNMWKMWGDRVVLDRERLEKAIQTGVRLLDDAVSVSWFPTEANREVAEYGRRIGLGLMGFHHLIMRLGIEYGGNEKCIKVIDEIGRIFRDASYETSISLAEERGAFPAFDRDRYLANDNIRKLPGYLRKRLREVGIRNVAVNTIAPTGTTAIIADTSSGIEPIYAPVFERRYYTDREETASSLVVDPVFKELVVNGGNVDAVKGATEISPRDHLEVQAAMQHWIDNSIAKTINLPAGYKSEAFKEDLMEVLPSLKGVTWYQDSTKEGQPLTAIKLTPGLVKKIREGKLETGAENNACKDGKCAL
jgi:ribonucleoside-diphosphate reductase alpha chain